MEKNEHALAGSLGAGLNFRPAQQVCISFKTEYCQSL